MKYIIGLLALLTFISFIFLQALDRHEKLECEQWQHDSQEYQFWYSTQNQKDQCSAYNINLK